MCSEARIPLLLHNGASAARLLDDVNLLLLTVKKNKEALVVAGVEGGNKGERMKDMFMSF